MRILAGDIGGTKTYLTLFEKSDDGYREVRSTRYVSAGYPSLEPICEEFLGQDAGSVTRAGFGVAGPVVDGACRATNLPWTLSQTAIQRALSAETRLVNDFYAVALGITTLRPADVEVLQEGEVDPNGVVAILGAGTGLGMASMVQLGEELVILPSEGAHADFAPRNDSEIGLLQFMRKRHERVSYDRLVSGPGIKAIYDYLVSTGEQEDADTKLRMAKEDSSAVIGSKALAGEDALCIKTVDMFLSMYGAVAGDLALTMLSSGGLYVAGGIAPRLLPLFNHGGFMDAFNFKGRLSPLAKKMRVHVIKQPHVGLLGAARAALGDSSKDAILLKD